MQLKVVENRVVLSIGIEDSTKECSDCGAPAIYRFLEVEPTIGAFGQLCLSTKEEWYWCGICAIGG